MSKWLMELEKKYKDALLGNNTPIKYVIINLLQEYNVKVNLYFIHMLLISNQTHLIETAILLLKYKCVNEVDYSLTLKELVHTICWREVAIRGGWKQICDVISSIHN